ncbi:MAG: glycosyltransferase [Pirellula sp.]|nr:glycosyltransferase [Pirellula sp.]
MRILYCHNYYRHRGGEDISFETDVEMLRGAGHSVITYTKSNAELTGNQIQIAARTIWNRETGRDISKLIDEVSPDVLHCNNLFPQISVSIYKAAKQRGIPIVQALRNYRAFCANSFLFRDDKVCLSCLKSVAAWHGILHRCYRGSIAASAVVAGMQFTHRLLRIQKRYVDAYFTPTEFSRQIHIEGGFEPDKVFVRSNFLLPDLGLSTQPGRYALFVGRLSREKGVETVIRAWKERPIDLPLRIVGEGPEEESLRKLAEGIGPIEFLGSLSIDKVQEQIAGAKLLIMPSLWYETFGRTVAEAFSRGVPVVASRLGAMVELVHNGENGFLFETGNSDSLADATARVVGLDHVAETQMRNSARSAFEKRFNAKVSYQQLMAIYEHAIKNAGSC